MAEISVEKLVVPRYGEKRVPQSSMPNINAWVVDAKLENVPFRLRMKPEAHQELSAIYHGLPEAADLVRGGGFVHGRPMIDLGIQLETCGGSTRPKKLYRVIHGDQPFGGIKARGWGVISINPLFFQTLFQKHMNWSCRNLSPFISVTDNLDKVKIIGAVYEAWGCSNIQILELDATSPAWNHEHRLWNVRDLVEKFDTRVLKSRKYLEQEFLVENSIPAECITRRYSWDLNKDRLDPDGFSRHRMSLVVKNRSRDCGGENTRDAQSGEPEPKVVVKRRRISKRVTDFKLRV